jgi:hypothetical protein
MDMQINDRNNFEGMSLGKFAGDREKILREEAPNLDKLDGFTKSAKEKEISLFGAGKKGAKGKVAETLAPSGAAQLPASSLSMDDCMIPANEGKITHMCLTYGLAGAAKENYLSALKTFVTHMPAAKFDILTGSDHEKNEITGYIKEWQKEGVVQNPDRIKIISTGQSFSIWAQDSTLVVGNHVVQQDRMWFPGYGDGAVAGELAKANPELKFQKMEGIFIDGGNQLATRDKIFVGSDVIAFMMKDMRSYPSKYETIQGALNIDARATASKEELCKLMLDHTFPHQQIVVVGYKGKQPAFHIDMAMTPLGKPDPETGKPVMVLGDPSLAIEMLKDIRSKDPQKYDGYEAGIASKLGYAHRNPLNTMIETLNGDKELQENFDSLAKGFERDGYKIERIPYLGSSSLRGTPWLSYNNSIFDGDNVFVPNFDIKELDDMANGIYKKYGYTPVPIEMNAVSSMQGAINCITKVIERSYA